MVKIGITDPKIGMNRYAHSQVKITRPAAAGLALTSYADRLSSAHARRNVNLKCLRFTFTGVGIGALKRKGAGGAVHDFFQRDEDIALDVGTRLRKILIIGRFPAATGVSKKIVE